MRVTANGKENETYLWKERERERESGKKPDLYFVMSCAENSESTISRHVADVTCCELLDGLCSALTGLKQLALMTSDRDKASQ